MGAPSKGQETAPLFPNNELEELRNRWNGIQTPMASNEGGLRGCNESVNSGVESAEWRLARRESRIKR
jgi:hypothetical protein